MSRRFAKLAENERRYDAETIAALTFQAKAWRILAIIATAEPDEARKHAQWLLFNTVPFVNGPVLEKFIAENEHRAEECGIKSGVFSPKAV